MTKKIRTVSVLALAAVCAAAGLVGCSGSDKTPTTSSEADPTVGNIGLKMSLPNGSTLTTVHYVVTGSGTNSTTNISGDIPVGAAGSTISVQVGLKAGAGANGYHVQLTGTSTDGKTQCVGSTDFDVTALQTTNVLVKLLCTGDKILGAARINGELDVCPTVDSYTVAPLQVAVNGDAVVLTSTASDQDPGTTLLYTWTVSPAGSGTVTPVAGNPQNASFVCTSPGQKTITITVADLPDPAAGDTNPDHIPCKDHQDIQVACVALACGNGTTEAAQGEQCDDGANNGSPTSLCTALCQLKCGNGSVDATAGEQCEPPSTIKCDAQCKNIVGCGNGIVETGEQCDHGLGVGNATGSATCDATCKTRCGNGTVDTAFGETCDPPGTATCDAQCHGISPCGNGTLDTGEQCDPPRVQICSATCANTACRTCELAAKCSAAETVGQRVTECESATGNVLPEVGVTGGGPLSGQTKSSACKQVVDCVRQNDCSNNGLNPEWCWCGINTDLASCLAGTPGPAGLCKSLIEAGAETNNISDVSARFADKGFATGLALRLINCDKSKCASNDINGNPLDPNGCF